MNDRLQQLLQPKKPEFKNFILRLDGQPKSSKTTLALTTSLQCPPPATWDAKKPTVLKDIMWMTFEPNALMYPASRGVTVANQLDWSDESLTLADLKPAIQALPAAAEQYRAQGVTTVVVDTLSAFNRFLLREIIERPTYEKDMDRIRAYGRVDEMHYLLFDSLRAMKMNIVGIVHLQAFQPFGEDGGNTPAALAMKAQAEKQTVKLEANQVAGMRTDYVPDIRPKPAGHWARLSDAVLVAKPRQVTVRAGVQEMKYEFIAQTTDGEFSAGGRWALPPINDGYLRPHIEAKYNQK